MQLSLNDRIEIVFINSYSIQGIIESITDNQIILKIENSSVKFVVPNLQNIMFFKVFPTEMEIKTSLNKSSFNKKDINNISEYANSNVITEKHKIINTFNSPISPIPKNTSYELPNFFFQSPEQYPQSQNRTPITGFDKKLQNVFRTKNNK